MSHMSICFMSSVMKENVAELISSSCIHQVFNLFLKGNIPLTGKRDWV